MVVTKKLTNCIKHNGVVAVANSYLHYVINSIVLQFSLSLLCIERIGLDQWLAVVMVMVFISNYSRPNWSSMCQSRILPDL